MTLAAALVQALSKITGYVGEAVVLPSGATQSETLREIEWSIFNNNTVIASYYGDKKKLEWFRQFTGRLSLNSSSGIKANKQKLIHCLRLDSTGSHNVPTTSICSLGDLTISNLTLSDAMVYKVDRLNGRGSKVQEVELIVRGKCPYVHVKVGFY